jgi:hypothetical protein
VTVWTSLSFVAEGRSSASWVSCRALVACWAFRGTAAAPWASRRPPQPPPTARSPGYGLTHAWLGLTHGLVMVNTHPAGLHTACWFRSELLHPHRPREAALAPPCRRFKKPILLRAHLHLCRAAMPVEAVRHAVERLKHRGRRLDASASSSASRVGGGALRERTHPATQHVCESRETERDGERAAHRLGGVQLATVARELPSQGGHWQSPFTPCSCTCLPSQGGHLAKPLYPLFMYLPAARGCLAPRRGTPRPPAAFAPVWCPR